MSDAETDVNDGVQQSSEYEDNNEAQQNEVHQNQVQDNVNEDGSAFQENASTEGQEETASSNTDIINGSLDTNQQANEIQQCTSETITMSTIGATTVSLSSLSQMAQITSDNGEITQITGLPPGVSLIQADQGEDGEGAIFLLVTGPVDGEEGTANAIAVDAATAAAMASLQNPMDAVTSGQSISIEGLASAVSNSKNSNDPVAEILSSLTDFLSSEGERVIVSTDESAVVQVAATAEAQAAATSKAYPSPSEVSLAQDILALASSALSSSAQKANNKDMNNLQHDNNNDQNEDYQTVDDGKPNWAFLLQDFQKIGESYHGFVLNEVEMDQVLNSYKKETNSLFAIRQTPSPVKEENGTVRLMWKSQHVPYDGVPFINIGRRATVMECEHGPRKKTNALKRMFNSSPVDKSSLKSVVNLTCPARVFIKKVRKFPEFKVVSTTDPKILRSHQEQSLKQLRELGMSTWTGGEIRLYMQLPDVDAHRYHMIGSNVSSSLDASGMGEYKTDISPRVVCKIKETVRQGVNSPFVVRQIARHFVEKEMITTGEEKIPKHDKSYFPTMIEIQNLTQQIQADLLTGVLSPLPTPADGFPQAKPKKRRSSVKSFGEPSNKRSASNGDYQDLKKEDEAGDTDGNVDGTTIGTFSLTLPEGQLENFSIANLNMEQLQQLAKIGLLALNNATSGKSNIPMATATVTESGAIEIDTSVSHAESTSVDMSEMSNETVVLLTSSMQDQVTSSEAEEAVQAIEPDEIATSTLEEASECSSAHLEVPSMVVSNLGASDAQPSTTTSDDTGNGDSVVSSVEATTTTDNTESMETDE